MSLDRYRFALGSAESARSIRRRIAPFRNSGPSRCWRHLDGPNAHHGCTAWATLGAILAACLRVLESEILLFINTLWLAGPLPCGLVPFAVAARAIV